MFFIKYRAISLVNVELKTNISELSISLNRVDILNGHKFLMYIHLSLKLMSHPTG